MSIEAANLIFLWVVGLTRLFVPQLRYLGHLFYSKLRARFVRRMTQSPPGLERFSQCRLVVGCIGPRKKKPTQQTKESFS